MYQATSIVSTEKLPTKITINPNYDQVVAVQCVHNKPSNTCPPNKATLTSQTSTEKCRNKKRFRLHYELREQQSKRNKNMLNNIKRRYQTKTQLDSYNHTIEQRNYTIRQKLAKYTIRLRNYTKSYNRKTQNDIIPKSGTQTTSSEIIVDITVTIFFWEAISSKEVTYNTNPN